MKRVGVIGGGQLAWMMAEGARQLGLELVIQTPHNTDPAVAIAQHTVFAPVDDAVATEALAAITDVITFENEFVDLKGLQRLADQGVQFFPGLDAIAPILDKFDQRQHLQKLGLPVPAFQALEPGLDTAITTFPVVLKARRHGYDGQGTDVIQDPDTLKQVLQRSGDRSLLLEEYIPFERELAIMAARSRTGELLTYPVVETQQVDQVCRRVFATGEWTGDVTQQVEAIAHTLLTGLNYVGILGIELFLTRDGRVLVNEIAPRTHNSGHYTLDACITSQFEQQLRAVGGLPLGNPSLHCPGAVMVNLLGFENSEHDYQQQRRAIASMPHTHVYWYGKPQSRPKRKLGHVTALLSGQTASERRSQAEAIVQQVEAIWYGS